MTIKIRLQEDMKTAMRAQDKASLSVIRLMLAAIKQVEIDSRMVLNEADILVIFDKMLKQRRESLTHYEQANRKDLADQETYEINLIQTYMPLPLTASEINQLIDDAVADCQAQKLQDLGKVMNLLKPKMQGRADMAQVSQLIKQRLS